MKCHTCASAGAEAEHMAEMLRDARLRDGLPWTRMAVLVRSGKLTIPALSRALIAAGVPVEVAGDEIPLLAEQAVRPLLLALRAARAGNDDPRRGSCPAHLTAGGLDSMGVRRLGRSLRQVERAELAGNGLPLGRAGSGGLRDPELLADCHPHKIKWQLGTLRRNYDGAAKLISGGGTAEEALWLLWDGSDWAERLRHEAAFGGDAGRRANRDLDAVCALFEVAGRSEEVAGLRGVTAFLAEIEGQQIPADTLREARPAAMACECSPLTGPKAWNGISLSSRACKKECGPTFGAAVRCSSRTGLAGADCPSWYRRPARIAEERRLFYVACTPGAPPARGDSCRGDGG